MKKHQWQSFYVTEDEYRDMKKYLEIIRKNEPLINFLKYLATLQADQFRCLCLFLKTYLR